MATNTSAYGLPSPVASAASPATSSISLVGNSSGLPPQRHHPLKPGSAKEIALISYVDDKVRRVIRRYGTKYADIKGTRDEAPGYTNLDQVIDDLNPLIDLVWTSGTPTIQIPYLLTFAGFVSSYLPAFPFTTKLFQMVRRFDLAFSSLLQSHEDTLNVRHKMSMTEKVRIKSIIEETRINAVHAASASGHSTHVVEEESDAEDMDTDLDDEDGPDSDESRIALAISKLYESTMQILGDALTPSSNA